MNTFKKFLHFLSVLSLVVFLIASLTWTSIPQVQAQSSPLRADAVVLVNTTSTRYWEFQQRVQPYLDQFGVAYTLVDISSSPLPSQLASYALIIIGHGQLDTTSAYLDASEQQSITSAISQGTGLVNFDSFLTQNGTIPLYTFVQNIFSFGYTSSIPSNQAQVQSQPSIGSYILQSQSLNATYTLFGSITPQGLIPDASTSVLLSIGNQPLLLAKNFGEGRAIQWASIEWMNPTIWGPLQGWDDMVWRSIVWAARKPFVMQALPPFVTFRVDDVEGPFPWLETAVNLGYRPWIGIFLDTITDVSTLKPLVDMGAVTVSIHARSPWDFFYFNHEGGENYPDTVINQNFADGNAWHTQNQIPVSKLVIPHYYEIGTNAFNGLNNWGVEFVGITIPPGRLYDGFCLQAGPYREWAGPDCIATDNRPFYYADDLSIDGHPEFAGEFMVMISEMRGSRLMNGHQTIMFQPL